MTQVELTCGTDTCKAPQTCCALLVLGSVPNLRCVSDEVACAGGSVLACETSAQCNDGMKCCLQKRSQLGNTSASRCEPACASAGATLCNKNDDLENHLCPAGTTCTSAGIEMRWGLPDPPYGTCNAK